MSSLNFVLVVLSLVSPVGWQITNLSGTRSPRDVEFLEFSTETFVATSFKDIQRWKNLAYAFKTTEKQFRGLLSRVGPKAHFEEDVVRLRVVFTNGDTFYVDRDGIVKHGAKEWKLNERDFKALDRFMDARVQLRLWGQPL